MMYRVVECDVESSVGDFDGVPAAARFYQGYCALLRVEHLLQAMESVLERERGSVWLACDREVSSA